MRQHPDIYLPQAKETAFFYHDYKYEKGLSYYEEHYFGSVNGEKAVGEVSPHYLYHTFCRDRIRENLRDLKPLEDIFRASIFKMLKDESKIDADYPIETYL